MQLLAQATERCLNIEVVVCREAGNHLVVIGGFTVPAANRAASKRQAGIHDDAFRIEELFDAETIAGRAGARRIVERKQPRLQFAQAVATNFAGEAV